MDKEIKNELEKQIPLILTKVNNIHLAIFNQPYLNLIMEGKKIIESRFSKNKILPYKSISKNDAIVCKESGGKITTLLLIKDVLFFDLKETSINIIKEKYNHQILGSEEYWNLKKNSNYGTLIIIDKIIKLKPFNINKKDMRSWIKL